MSEHDASAAGSGGGIEEHEASAVSGGGGIVGRMASAVTGGRVEERPYAVLAETGYLISNRPGGEPWPARRGLHRTPDRP